MVTISYFHTNTHRETLAPLITCVDDDTDGEKCSSIYQVYDVKELQQHFIDVWHGFEQNRTHLFSMLSLLCLTIKLHNHSVFCLFCL